MNMLKAVVVITISVTVVIIAQRWFGHVTLPARHGMGGEALVVVETVAPRDFANRIEAIGTAAANESVTVTSTVAERVAQILFESGARVKRGDLLVQLENTEEQADFEVAKVSLAEQEREFKRMRDLREKKVISEQSFDTQRSAVDSARARLLAAQARLQDRAVTAPFSGILGIRQVSPGAMVSPGTLITTLDDIATIKADFTVPETFLAEIASGQEIEARSAAWPGEVFHGEVTSIDSRVDPTTRAVTVQARVPNPEAKLRAGMLLTVELISRPRTAIGIPEKALLAFAEKQFVYVLQADQTVLRRQVRLGRRNAGWVEILDGLQEGEVIVVDGLMSLRDGAKAQIAPAPDAESDRPAAALRADQ